MNAITKILTKQPYELTREEFIVMLNNSAPTQLDLIERWEKETGTESTNDTLYEIISSYPEEWQNADKISKLKRDFATLADEYSNCISENRYDDYVAKFLLEGLAVPSEVIKTLSDEKLSVMKTEYIVVSKFLNHEKGFIEDEFRPKVDAMLLHRYLIGNGTHYKDFTITKEGDGIFNNIVKIYTNIQKILSGEK